MTPTVVDLRGSLAAVVRRTWRLPDLREAQRAARTSLDAALRGHDHLLGSRLTIWRPPEAGMIDYAPGVILKEAVPVSGDVALFSIPAGRAAHLRMSGGYEGLPEAWQRLIDGSAAMGLRLAGLNWEIYADPGDAADRAGADLYAMLA